jgi:hypothetical protein
MYPSVVEKYREKKTTSHTMKYTINYRLVKFFNKSLIRR